MSLKDTYTVLQHVEINFNKKIFNQIIYIQIDHSIYQVRPTLTLTPLSS